MGIEVFSVGPLGTNCYLIYQDGGTACAVIDPGDKRATVLRELQARGLTLDAILLTHGHFDHVGGVGALAAAFPDAAIYMHPGDLGDDGRLRYTPPGGWQRVSEGDVISAGGLTIEVLHTPGHSPGSVVYRCCGCLLTGDTLFQGSAGRTDFAGGDEAAMTASLARLGRLDGDWRVLPGHMGLSTLDIERQSNLYLRGAMGL